MGTTRRGVSSSSEGSARARESAESVVSRPRGKRKGANGQGLRKTLWATIKHSAPYRLMKKGSVPDYLEYNEFILSGYRVNFTLRDSFMSIFRLHNETLNIWTHAIGFLLFFGLMVTLLCAPPVVKIANHKLEQLENLHLLESARNNWNNLHLRELRENAQDLGKSLQLGEHAKKLRQSLHMKERAQKLMDSLHIQESAENLRKMVGGVEDRWRSQNATASMLASSSRSLREKVSQRLRQSLDVAQDNAGKFLKDGSFRLRDKASHLKKIVADVELWPMHTYLVGAMFCMLSSTLAHTFSICSKRACDFLWRLDYVGIAVMISCSFYPLVYYLFLCDWKWQAFYLVSISMLGAAVSYISLAERFQAHAYRDVRAYLFIALGAFGIFPMLHGMYKHEVWQNENLQRLMGYEGVMAGLYLLGATIYAKQFPERMFPGKFDIFFHSHQWFHVLIVVAAYFHYIAGMKAIDWGYTTSQQQCPSAQDDALFLSPDQHMLVG